MTALLHRFNLGTMDGLHSHNKLMMATFILVPLVVPIGYERINKLAAAIGRTPP